MSASPKNRSTNGNLASVSDVIVPAGQTLGNKLRSFAKSRLPVPNKPKVRTQQRRIVVAAAPIPFAPLVDKHVFQPPPPYSARPNEPADFLVVPNNTPEASPLIKDNSFEGGANQHSKTPDEPGPRERAHTMGRSSGEIGTGQLVGLGFDGLEKGDGGHFDGLGRLSGGFRPSLSGTDVNETVDTSQELREEVQRKLMEHSRRQRDRANVQPKKRHDVFYASLSGEENRKASSQTVCPQSTASPTPLPRVRRPLSRINRDLSRGTISTELKRAASLERRASLSIAKEGLVSWRM